MKKENLDLEKYYLNKGNLKKANRVSNCSTKEFYFESINIHSGEVGYQYLGKHRCHDKFCPICSKVKSNYEKFLSYQILPSIIDDNYKALSVTITMKRISIYKLSEYITLLHDIFRNVLSNSLFKKYVYGSMSKIEWSNIIDDTVNIHLHAILFVKGSILGRKWVSSQKLSDLVQSIGRFDYNPVCKISKVGNTNIQKTINYILKPQVFDINHIDTLDKQLSYKHLYTYTGIYKDKRHNVKEIYKNNNSLKNKILELNNDDIYYIKSNELDT